MKLKEKITKIINNWAVKRVNNCTEYKTVDKNYKPPISKYENEEETKLLMNNTFVKYKRTKAVKNKKVNIQKAQTDMLYLLFEDIKDYVIFNMQNGINDIVIINASLVVGKPKHINKD